RNHKRVTAPNFLDLPNDGIEFGNQGATRDSAQSPERLILASYNIRYAVGRFLIASGLGRKLGANFPRPRAQAIDKNIRTAARVFTENTLLPPHDILAL